MNHIDQMQAFMLDYFSAEKYESAAFVLIGAAAIGLSVLVYFRFPLYKGILVPLLAVAVIQVAVGSGVFLRTDSQVRLLEARLHEDSRAYQAEETARMETVMRNFTVYKIIEISLLAGGIALTFLFAARPFLYSLGIGLIIQPSLMLVLDLLAEKRAAAYFDHVRSLL